ncbi:hypothetical protein ABEP18_19285 [Priestia megaterium]
MKKIYFIVFILSLMCGCQGKDQEPLDFSGENKNWSANVNVNPAENDKEIALIKLNYLGKQPESIGDFGVSLENSNNKNGIGIRDIQLDKEGKFKGKIEVDTDKEMNTSDPLVLTVKWNDKLEDIVLKAQ